MSVANVGSGDYSTMRYDVDFLPADESGAGVSPPAQVSVTAPNLFIRNPLAARSPTTTSPQTDFFDSSRDLYLMGRMVHLGGSPTRSPFEPLDHLPPFVPPPLPPEPQETIWSRIYRVVRCIPANQVRVVDEETIMREGLTPLAQKLFDDLPRFHPHFVPLSARHSLARRIVELFSNRPFRVEVIKRDKVDPNSRTITRLPNGAVTVKLDLLAVGGNKKVYEALYFLPNGEIKKVVEQRYKKCGGMIPTPPFSLAQEALLADLFDSPYVVKGPIAYYPRENGNQSVVMPRYDSDFDKKLRNFDLKTTLSILRDISEGLAHIHSRGCAHRDVKPLNIFIQILPDGTPRGVVADLGYLVSEFRCSQLRREILQPIELEYMGMGLFDSEGESKFICLSRFLDLSGGLYPLNIVDAHTFQRKGIYPTLREFGEFVEETVKAMIKLRYTQPSDQERNPSDVFSPQGNPFFPLFAEYLNLHKEFPKNIEFIKFIKTKVLGIVEQAFKSNGNIFDDKGAVWFPLLKDMMFKRSLVNFPSKKQFTDFLNDEVNPTLIARYRGTEAYRQVIQFLEKRDEVILEFTHTHIREFLVGNLPRTTSEFIDPNEFKKTMQFLVMIENGVRELREWEHGIAPTLPSSLSQSLQLHLYPLALSFLKKVTDAFKQSINFAGTFHFMAPEQIHSGIITSKGDVYPIGLMLRSALEQPHISTELSSLTSLHTALRMLRKEMTNIKYQERPTAEQCAEHFKRILATYFP